MGPQTSELKALEHTLIDASVKPTRISFSDMESITDNFSREIGRGGFGVVYEGMLRNGKVAVKKLIVRHDFSDDIFEDEVNCLIRAKHKNIVRFLGYCADIHGQIMEIKGKYRIAQVPQRLLCFEYVSNGNLQSYLQEKYDGYNKWNIRYQIIKGICHGLHYLHQEHIIHLDLKPENVLLDSHMEPKITDFGLSRCFDGKQSRIFTKKCFGTPGYIAPEFIDKGEISFKSDIFSLGVIMIKLLTWSCTYDIKDWQQAVEVDCPQKKTCIEIAQVCVHSDQHKRPTIGEVIRVLNDTESMVQKPPLVTNNGLSSDLFYSSLQQAAVQNKIGRVNEANSSAPNKSVDEVQSRTVYAPCHLLRIISLLKEPGETTNEMGPRKLLGEEVYELRMLLRDKVEVRQEALLLVLEYLYSGQVCEPPKTACICADEDGCAHFGCRPAVSFMTEVLFASSTFKVNELTNRFEGRLLDILDKVQVDDLPLILSVANLCKKSCVKLFERCLETIVQSNLDLITLEKALRLDVAKQIVDARLSLGLVSPVDKGFPNIHVRRIHRALDAQDIDLVRMLLEQGKTNLDDAFALHYAVQYCDSKVTAELLDLALADVNHRNRRGYTVLHIAARRMEPAIIISLLNKGARPSDLTVDNTKALQISKRVTKHVDYFRLTEKGKQSPKDRLCIDILERQEASDTQLREASVSRTLAGDSLYARLLYLENRVALARILFPSEAELAMAVAEVDGTSEFTLGSSGNQPSNMLMTIDLNESPFVLKEEHLARMRALSKTVELVKSYFPRCSEVVDKIMGDDEADNFAFHGGDTSIESRLEKKRRLEELRDEVRKAFMKE